MAWPAKSRMIFAMNRKTIAMICGSKCPTSEMDGLTVPCEQACTWETAPRSGHQLVAAALQALQFVVACQLWDWPILKWRCTLGSLSMRTSRLCKT